MFQFFGLSPAPKYEYNVVKVDTITGFSEFPSPDDVKKTNLLPLFIDLEEEERLRQLQSAAAENSLESTTLDNKVDIIKNRDFWMPDNLCKVCYNCEEIFTMYRRKHHCRICGQIFCHACSNYSIDGSYINLPPGQVRVCRLCYDQIYELNNANKELLAEIGHILPSKITTTPKSKRITLATGSSSSSSSSSTASTNVSGTNNINTTNDAISPPVSPPPTRTLQAVNSISQQQQYLDHLQLR
jgi:1-phosphatidylinositol-3-phosphate 5-kinase